jgi:hypothetical protein
MEGTAFFKQMVKNKANELFCNTDVLTYRECQQLAHTLTSNWISVYWQLYDWFRSTEAQRMSRSVACRNGQGRKFYV